MSKVSVFMAEGMEEVECLAVVDMLKRGGVETETVSVMDSVMVTGSHGITVKADRLFADQGFADSDLLFLPGGVPGTPNLAAHEGLCALLKEFAAGGKRLAAICAAPSVLGGLGLLQGKKATCYPGWENKLAGARCEKDGVVTDGLITTGRGVGFAIDMGLELVRLLEGEERFLEVKQSIQHPQYQ